ncbi:hypothetical protein [Acinetobacter sp. YH12145]|uniref:hypothetical protein n=1 Tax=Acinetobacter sp. YH12145 TaxID=2601129 RepID=UPI0015D27DC7|nr:hypothetical protein [Acinetobacter sp. YH12145]
MSEFNIINIGGNYSKDKIYADMESLLDKFGRLLVLLDVTLEADCFKELKRILKEENIIYLPLALGNKSKDTNLFFVEIANREILGKIGKEICEKITANFDIQNNKYFVHGFGASLLENKMINERFKKSLVVQDITSKILFRWYDPRVLSYLDQIFHEVELNSLLGIFESWKFVHPTGYFSWNKTKDQQFISRKIYKLSPEQSLALDLIEISNQVFVQSFNYEEIDKENLNPKNILLNLYMAHEKNKVDRYADLFTYGLYAEILGRNFLIHPEVKNILEKYWERAETEYDFNEAMNFIDRDLWKVIKQDLKKLEIMTHG